MRNMLTRAAEIRESEQQQIFDALDEINARMSPLESLGSVRKRLSELPDRTEIGVLAERLDEALAKLETQDGAISGLNTQVEGITDKLAEPFAQLDGRMDGMAGRFDGVAGRMDGMEDKLSHIHKRLDELGAHLGKQDERIESLPNSVHGPVRERIDSMETSLRGRFTEMDEGVHEHLDGTREALNRAVTESAEGVRSSVGEAVSDSRQQLQGKLDELAERPAVDPTDRLQQLADQMENLANRLDRVSGRLDSVEENVNNRLETVEQGVSSRLETVEQGVNERLGDLGGTLATNLSEISGTLAERPDTEALSSLVRDANEDSERKHAGQLDEAMATFAELILGGGAPQSQPAPTAPTALPRQQRRGRSKSAKRDDKPGEESDDITAETA
ncbi:coiled-coil domain-containing protein [Halosaccharopolyspora lacisalsi]